MAKSIENFASDEHNFPNPPERGECDHEPYSDVLDLFTGKVSFRCNNCGRHVIRDKAWLEN